MSKIIHFNTIAQIHKMLGLAEPKHPLISFYHDQDIENNNIIEEGQKFTSELYIIFFKNGNEGSIGYGRSTYDFENSTLVFIGPNQVITSPEPNYALNCKGWTLMFHPDLIRRSNLGKSIDEYNFFNYELNEALHLSEQERIDIEEITQKLTREYSQNIDRHSQTLIISNLELLLNYCLRFYDRQFYTRTNFNKDFVSRFAREINNFYTSNTVQQIGIPTVKHFAEKLSMSPNYLSDLLKKETGKSAKNHINDFVINKAKNLLLSTPNTVSEIAYSLGFEYPQGLNKLFKNKTGMSPAEYRISKN